MVCKGLKLNSILEILWEDDVYCSNVQDITSEYIAISIPIQNGEYLPLSCGNQFEVIYYNKDAVYKFKTVVKERKVNNIPILIIEIPKEVIRIQRRKFVRIETILDIEYTKIKNNSMYKNIENLNEFPKKGFLTDVSGGGIKFVAQNALKAGDCILLKLNLENELIVVKGKAIRVEKNDDGNYICGINFIEINQKHREKIISYVFELMRKQRRNLKED